MRALTLWQPWAHAIAHLGKRVENRPWPPPREMIGKRIAIHAGARYEVTEWSFPDRVRVPPRSETPLKAIVCVATIVGYRDERKRRDRDDARAAQRAMFDATRRDANVVSVGRAQGVDLSRDAWWIGPVGWLLDDVVALGEPVPCSGSLKLWELPVAVEALVAERFRLALTAGTEVSPTPPASAPAG